jgi:(p)ppGpp synthase/HD superfamily hydrolase
MSMFTTTTHEAKRNAALFERALAIALRAHAGQVDKGGAPYIAHPLRVALSLDNPIDRVVGLLHDVLEDSDVPLDGMPDEVVAAVEAMTHRKGEDWDAYLERVAANPISLRVKLADLRDNLDPRRLGDKITARDAARMERYRAAFLRLFFL